MFDLVRLPPDTLIFPVFDGVPGKNKTGKQQPVDQSAYEAFITGVHHSHYYRVAKSAPQCYLPNFRNVVDPTFFDSARAPLLQLADVVSYLLGVLDSVQQREPTAFKARLGAVAAKLDRSIVHRIAHSMKFQGA
jgi:hypothetical protein